MKFTAQSEWKNNKTGHAVQFYAVGEGYFKMLKNAKGQKNCKQFWNDIKPAKKWFLELPLAEAWWRRMSIGKLFEISRGTEKDIQCANWCLYLRKK